MAEALIKAVVDNLSSLSQREIALICGANKEMAKLRDTFSAIQAVLQDAELKQHSNEPIKHWLRRLRQAAYQADDILDNCATEAIRLELKAPRSGLLNKAAAPFVACYSPIENVVFRYKIGRKIKDINESLDAIDKDRTRFGLSEISSSDAVGPSSWRRWRETISTLTEPRVLGRDSELESIVAQLVRNDDGTSGELSVLAIFGMGGLGKTTLAQMVFNDSRVVEHFELRIWVCVSDEDFDKKRIIKAIMGSVCNGGCEGMDLEPLQRRLREKLNGKRFFLVLDDVWKANQENWEELRGVLNCGSKGASVIITTRLQPVASIMGTLPQRKLSLLSEDDCWSLFKQRAFGPNGEENADLVAIGKEIVKKCGGVPLAAKALGSLMRFKTTEQEWEMVKKSEIWDLDLPQGESSVLPALRLSYMNLPPELRQCFAYCSVFKKDSVMEKEKVIQQWMANGFIGSKGLRDPEDIGNEIWRQLYWTSFFQEVKNDEFGDVYRFKMHDLVHDLATSVVDDDQYKQPATFMLPRDAKLRTYMANFKEFEMEINAGDCSSLRALTADGISEVGIRKLRNFKHLRYLDLSRSSGIRALPDSICELVNLQTLNMNRCTRLENLPRGITRLKSLRHLYLDRCDSLRQMPRGIGELKNLKTLTLFVVDGRRGCGLDELQELDLGGKLVIKRLNRSINVRAGNINLGRKQKIRELVLHWESESVSETESESQEQLLEALQPHPNLRSLRIDGYGGSSFPSWMRTPIPTLQNLRSIELANCKNCQRLPPLGQLAYLKGLEIAGMEKVRVVVEDDFYACGGLSSSSSSVGRFPSLKALNIERLPCLEKLCEGRDGDGDAFPRLSTLRIMDCPKLKSLPCILSLKYLSVWGSTTSVLLSSISNLPHLAHLYVSGNEEDVCFPGGFLQGLSSLKFLSIESCDVPESLPETGIQGLKSLQDLGIVNCAKLKCLPEALPHLTSLRSLYIINLPALTSLPDGLGKLASLQSLAIWSCPNLASLPHTIQSLTNLKSLEIGDCPQLESRYSSERGGEYHHQIAHIPGVRF